MIDARPSLSQLEKVFSIEAVPYKEVSERSKGFIRVERIGW